MRGFDMTPLLRTTVGFDRLARTMDSLANDRVPSYPPYNIEKLDDDDYVVTMALAGFSQQDLEITLQENTLTVSGNITAPEESGEQNFLYRGIAARSFSRQFSLADHIKVADASLENGLLHISLKREVPEAAKPKSIPISVSATAKRKTIEQKAA